MDDTLGNTSAFPQDAESVRAVPSHAEPYGNIPHDSALFRNVPHSSETVGSVPHRSERTEHHTLTVRDAARMFEQADVARTERSITNWCQPDKNGVSRLDCYYDQNEHKWFMTRQSVDRAIQEEQAKARIEHGNRPSEEPEEVPKRAEAQQEPPKEEAATTHQVRKITELEAEVRDLSIASGVKDLYIKRLEKENESLRDNVEKHVDHLIQLNRHTGRLEGLLGLPEPHMSGDGTYVIDAPPTPRDTRKTVGHPPTNGSEWSNAAPDDQRNDEPHDHPQEEYGPERTTSLHERVSIPVRSVSDSPSHHPAYDNPPHSSQDLFQNEERHQ